MIHTSQLSTLASVFRFETEKESISLETVGKLFHDILDLLATASTWSMGTSKCTIPQGDCRSHHCLGERKRLPASVAMRRAVLSGMPGFSMIGLKPVLVRLKCPFSSTRTTMSLYLTMRYSAS